MHLPSVPEKECSNRTFMELKCFSRVSKLHPFSVLIAPLWNWNAKYVLGTNNHLQGSNRTFMELKCDKLYIKDSWVKVLIAPLWNWNCQGWQSGSISDGSSNRTFMELKCISPAIKSARSYRSNRTFMELKLYPVKATFKASFVLIAPLWNWNDIATRWAWPLPSSNRTFMELKSILAVFTVPWMISSNRTFMELKSDRPATRRAAPRVLIAPLWNWNGAKSD